MKKRILVCLVAVLLMAVATLQPVRATAPICQIVTDAFCYQPSTEKTLDKIKAVTMPEIAVPVWSGVQP